MMTDSNPSPATDIDTMEGLEAHLTWCRKTILAAAESPTDSATVALALGVAYGALVLTWSRLCDAMGFKETLRGAPPEKAGE